MPRAGTPRDRQRVYEAAYMRRPSKLLVDCFGCGVKFHPTNGAVKHHRRGICERYYHSKRCAAITRRMFVKPWRAPHANRLTQDERATLEAAVRWSRSKKAKDAERVLRLATLVRERREEA